MIPVQLRPEPSDFEARVRAKGRRVLEKHKPEPPVPREFWKNKEHWRHAVKDLHDRYGRICAFAAIRIELVTGFRTVEHFKPVSRYPELAYEWSNFRLVCGMMNGRKGDHEDVLDPFEIPENTFDLNFISGEVKVHRDCPRQLRPGAESTIERLKLNDGECRRVRREHCSKLVDGSLNRDDSPFVFSCCEKQGLL